MKLHSPESKINVQFGPVRKHLAVLTFYCKVQLMTKVEAILNLVDSVDSTLACVAFVTYSYKTH